MCKYRKNIYRANPIVENEVLKNRLKSFMEEGVNDISVLSTMLNYSPEVVGGAIAILNPPAPKRRGRPRKEETIKNTTTPTEEIHNNNTEDNMEKKMKEEIEQYRKVIEAYNEEEEKILQLLTRIRIRKEELQNQLNEREKKIQKMEKIKALEEEVARLKSEL